MMNKRKYLPAICLLLLAGGVASAEYYSTDFSVPPFTEARLVIPGTSAQQNWAQTYGDVQGWGAYIEPAIASGQGDALRIKAYTTSTREYHGLHADGSTTGVTENLTLSFDMGSRTPGLIGQLYMGLLPTYNGSGYDGVEIGFRSKASTMSSTEPLYFAYKTSGATWVFSEVTVSANKMYHFEVTTDMTTGTYDFSIMDGETEIWSANDILFANPTTAFNTVSFSAWSTATSSGTAEVNYTYGYIDNLSITTAVPEPVTAMLLGLGSLVAIIRRKK